MFSVEDEPEDVTAQRLPIDFKIQFVLPCRTFGRMRYCHFAIMRYVIKHRHGIHAFQFEVLMMGRYINFCTIAALGFILWMLLPANAKTVIFAGHFSACRANGDFPPGWEPLTFDKIGRHTRYTLVSENGKVVVKAESNASASGMVRKVDIDAEQHPVIAWRWKIQNVYRQGNVKTREGDDSPARIYITFHYNPDHLDLLDRIKYQAAKLLYGKYPPTGALNYIWASKVPLDAIVMNPYTDRSRMIVVQSGTQKAGQWIREQRNVYDDYLKAFGTKPPLISGIGIMTDSDNTGESAVAYFGDIVFESG